MADGRAPVHENQQVLSDHVPTSTFVPITECELLPLEPGECEFAASSVGGDLLEIARSGSRRRLSELTDFVGDDRHVEFNVLSEDRNLTLGRSPRGGSKVPFFLDDDCSAKTFGGALCRCRETAVTIRLANPERFSSGTQI